MRHRVFGKKLGRDINARKALLANLANSVLEYGHVTTTQSKAKFARSHIEKLITKAKKNRMSLRREMASSLTHKAFMKLIDEVGPGFAKRYGGYLRIIKLGKRRGDASPMAKLELVKWDETLTKVKVTKTKKVKKIKETKISKIKKDKKKITKGKSPKIKETGKSKKATKSKK